ncbi:MAG: hypothetical protein JWO38_6349, partial [Gemmataceae bacterium]|nr:hypothetical protein [Gemmataceae bacterium]
MSTTPPQTDRPFRQRWTDFWFSPGDPTTLGFIRIVTGLLILYTHLAYSLDLQAFFGKYGWYGSDYIERERMEFPHRAEPIFDWDEIPPPRAPEVPHRRKAVLGFIRGLPGPAADRTRAIHYLDRVSREENPVTAAGLMNLVAQLYTAGTYRDKLLTGMEEGRQFYIVEGEPLPSTEAPANRRYTEFFPQLLLVLPAPDRKDVAADLREFLAALPKTPVDAGYVVAHLGEMDQPHRRALVMFLSTLPDDPAERAKLIDYFEYWNNDPRRLYREGHSIVSVWFHVTDPTQMALVHALILTIMVLFTLGICTRVTAVLTWIAVVGYVHRTNQILFGMDTMMNILLLYLMIGNSGAALSVDRLIARYRAVRASLRRAGTIDDATRAFLAQAPPSVGANLGIRLIQVHFCFIYMAAGLAKLKGPGWWSGNAFWDVMINPEFTLMKYEWFENMVRAIASVKPLYYTITAVGVWFTWGLEISFPFLVWTRARPVMLWMAVLLHAGIGILMGLNLFELMMMTMMLAYLPAGVIRDRLRGGPDLPKLGFEFDSAEPGQARAAAVVAAVDVDAQAALAPTRGRDLPAVVAPGGAV